MALQILVEGDHTIAAVRWPLVMVLTAVAVAIVGVVIALISRCPGEMAGNA